MVKIVVFDSGMGSLSIIKPLQKVTKSEIIYFADRKNFPYGKKPKSELRKIIEHSLIMLQERFNPDLIIVGSNTPTLLLKNVTTKKNYWCLTTIKASRKNFKNKKYCYTCYSVCL